jgi:hypothetical protein
MATCKELGYKEGDYFLVIENACKGEILQLEHDDGTNLPYFTVLYSPRRDYPKYREPEYLAWVKKIPGDWQAYKELVDKVRTIDKDAADFLLSFNVLNGEFSCNFKFSGALGSLFFWHRTPQGHTYWSNINDKLIRMDINKEEKMHKNNPMENFDSAHLNTMLNAIKLTVKEYKKGTHEKSHTDCRLCQASKNAYGAASFQSAGACKYCPWIWFTGAKCTNNHEFSAEIETKEAAIERLNSWAIEILEELLSRKEEKEEKEPTKKVRPKSEWPLKVWTPDAKEGDEFIYLKLKEDIDGDLTLFVVDANGEVEIGLLYFDSKTKECETMSSVDPEYGFPLDHDDAIIVN